MKVLETVLNFFLTLAQVIFPRKRKPSPSDRPCPPPQPPPPVPPLPLEGGNGSDPGLHRRDSLPPEEQDPVLELNAATLLYKGVMDFYINHCCWLILQLPPNTSPPPDD